MFRFGPFKRHRRESPPDLLSVDPHGNAYFSQAVASCGLRCTFCSVGLRKRRDALRRSPWQIVAEQLQKRLPMLRIYDAVPDASPATTARAVEMFRKALEGLPAPHRMHTEEGAPPSTMIGGDDVLEFDGLFEVLDICREHERRVVLATPGLRLADESFARRLRDYDPFLVTTCLAVDARVYERMTDRADARDLVHRALRNVAELDFEYSVNFVVTRDNFRELVPVAELVHAELGLDVLSCLYFIVGSSHMKLDPNTPRRLVSMRELAPVLTEYARRFGDTRNMVWLDWIPPCKLPDEVLSCRRIKFMRPTPPDPDVEVHRAPECGACDYAEHCTHVTAPYQATFGYEPFDSARVNAWLPGARSAEQIQ